MTKFSKYIHLLVVTMLLLFLSQISQAQLSAPSIYTLGMGGSSQTIIINDQEYMIQQSIGQMSSIGTYQTNTLVLQQGFIQPASLEVQSTEAAIALKTTIYPNPVTTSFTITMLENTEEPILVNIYDLAGRTIYTQQFEPAYELTIDLSFLKAGAFMINIKTSNKQNTFNLLKN